MFPKRESLFVDVTVFFISVVIAIFISEVIVRKFADFKTAKVIYKGDMVESNHAQFKISDDPILLYEWKQAPQEVMRDKPKNTFRIIVVGDSITYRSMWALDDYYPKVLQDLLNSHSRGLRYEVMNAGVPGYNIVQEARFLEKRLLKYSSDMVIVGYCSTNDRAIKRKFVKYRDGLYSCDVIENYPYVLNLPFNSILLRHSALYRLINLRLANVSKTNRAFYKPQIKYFDLTGETEIAIKKLKDLSERNKFALLLVIFPALSPGSQYECDWIVRKCDEYNIEYIDLRKIFEAAGYENLRISDADFCHPNKRGQEICAQAIFEYCKEISKQLD